MTCKIFSVKKMVFSILVLATNLCFAGDPKVSLEALKAKLMKLGAPKLEGTEKVGDQTVPVLFFGKQKLNLNFTGVDDVKKALQGTATVFVKSGAEYIRVSTNVLKEDGTRAVGTPLAHNAAYDAIQKGNTFCGKVEIAGSPYDTCYEPIKVGSDVVGIYYAGYKQ
jgi:hypothetical protein